VIIEMGVDLAELGRIQTAIERDGEAFLGWAFKTEE